MNSLVDKQTERRFNLAFITLFSLLFLLAPSYYQPNLGGEGLFLPFNNVVWIFVSFILGLALLKILHTQHFLLPRMTYAMLFFLGTTTILGMTNSVATPIPWLFRSLALWGGVLFFLAVAQFRLNRREQENLLYILMISTAIQSIYGTIQIIYTDPPPSWLPISLGVPRGIFQQENINVSFSATGLILAIFLSISPSFKGRMLIIRIATLITVALTTATLISSGARIGLIGVSVGLLVILFTQRKKILQNKQIVAILFIFSIAGGISATYLDSRTGGIESGINKLSAVVNNSFRSAIYKSSWELIKEKPILGHGIGQFQRVWHNKKIEYIKANPNEPVLIDRLTHPHNELLYWTVEGGIVASVGILAMMGSFLFCCIQLGWQRGGAYIALLIPIAIHTQVELPFYTSQLHWITFITLVALAANHRKKIHNMRLSSYAKVLCLSIAMALPIISTVFLSDSLSAINTTINYVTGKVKGINSLDHVKGNIYHADHANLLRLQLFFQVGIKENNEDILREYVVIAKAYLVNTPEVGVFNGLAVALHRLKQYDLSHNVIARSLDIYPTNPVTLAGRDKIMELDREAGIFDKYWRLAPAPNPQ